MLAPPYGPVLSGERVVERLGEGPGTLTFGMPLEALARSYVERALSGTGGVLVDEWFGLVVTLEPLAEDGHGAGTAIGLQDRERLRDRAETSFPVRFTVGRDGAIDY